MPSVEEQETQGGNGDVATREARDPHAPPSRPPAKQEDRKADEPKKPFFKRPIGMVVLAVVVLGIIGGVIYWLYARQFEETDDAFIDGNTVAISAKVPGTVLRVLVNDNQDVAAGTLMVQLDPKDIQARLDKAQASLDAARSKLDAAKTNVELTKANTAATLSQAEAGVAQAKAGVTAAESQLASAQADVTAAEAEAQRRQADIKRYQALDPRGVSQQQLDVARAAAESGDANLTAAKKRVAGAQSAVAEAQAKVTAAQAVYHAAQTAPQQVASAEAQQKTAQAAVEEAAAAARELQLELSYTRIYAPVAGRVTRKSVVPGNNVAVGANLMAVVQPDVWVVANFKETQLTNMRRGQEVDIDVDAYPNKTFHGKVDSIQAGTGARFSLLPPENATGNYVKVVQRVPVKILFDKDPEAKRLLALGMSVVPKVHIATGNDNVEPLPVEPPSNAAAPATTQPDAATADAGESAKPHAEGK